MNALKLVQTTSDGRVKSWKLNPGVEVLTFGTSRKATINSIDKNVASFESVIEFRNSKWHYISFSMADNADLVINQDDTIKLSNSTLKFEVINKNLELHKNIEALNLHGPNEQQLVLVSKNNKMVALHVKDPTTTFSLFSEGKRQKLSLPLSDSWATLELADYSVKFKKINTQDVNSYLITDNKIIDKESKAAVITVLALTALLVGGALLVPQNKNITPVVQIQTSSTLIVKSELKKKTKKEQNTASTPNQQTLQNNNQSSSGGKVTALLKGSLGVRISKLIGKVSATEARTTNVLATNSGLKAGEPQSGRALAAIGKIESSGRNWSGESKGSGQGVSTAGIGGGNSGKGLSGGLAQGKTGSGGVGLIEDESEIVGGLDREIIAQYIKTQLGQILYCYERQLSANPNLFGKIAVKFTIAGSGQVETQSINDTTLKNASVEACVLSKISRWKFPEPKGGTKVLVTYPFLFKSTI